MLKTSNKKWLPKLVRVKQKTNSHCGPAVLHMFFKYWGKTISQDEFVIKSGIKDILKSHGMIPSEMAEAVGSVPGFNFWSKQNATIDELREIVNEYKIPVGVEWQGVFGKYSDGDDGHYSIVVHVDRRQDRIWLMDPYRFFYKKDRIFHIEEFAKRWWDFNQVDYPKDRRKHLTIKDRQMMFLVLPKSRTFPKRFRMKVS